MSEPLIREARQNDPAADRATGAVVRDVKAALAAGLFARARMIEVTRGQALFGTRRVYTTIGELTSEVEIFSTGETLVPHGLGQTPKGWLVVGRLADSRLFTVTPSAPTDPAQYLVFRASLTAKFSVVVF